MPVPARLVCLAVLLAMGIILFPPPAEAGDVYLVRDVPISSRAASAAQARTIALRNGHSAALAALLRRITLPEHQHLLPSPSARAAQAMALGFEVADEKSSNVRYLGKLSVRFAPEQVRQLLQKAGIPLGDIQARPALLLVVQEQEDTTPALWDVDSPLQRAFEGMDITNNLTPLILPAGDAGDRISFPERALAPLLAGRNEDALFALMNRYDLRHALLVYAREDRASAALSVSLAWIRPGTRPTQRSFVVPFNPEEAGDVYWTRIARNALAIIADSWKRRVLVSGAGAGEQRIAVLFGSQQQWHTIRERLRALPVMRDYRLHSLSVRGALVDVNIAAPADIFALALAQEDMLLDTGSTPWKLSLSQ